jgi:phosphohistidine phosphatase
MPTKRSLYLVRHAIAAERSDKWPDDSKRPLTHEGAARMRHVVQGLVSLDVRLELVLTSPLVRAVETADILSHGLKSRPPVVKLPVLAPGGAPNRVAEALASYTKPCDIALVGHEPELGELAAWLIGSRVPLLFRKGGICRIDAVEWPPARQNQLIWFAPPRLLRSLK